MDGSKRIPMKDPDIFRLKNICVQTVKEALHLWEFCLVMAELKEQISQYILYESQKGECIFDGDGGSWTKEFYSKKLNVIIHPFYKFYQSVEKIKIQNDQPSLLPFEELDIIIKKVGQFAKEHI